MAKRLGKFELPKRLIKVEASATPIFASYVIEPLEKGFGETLGNSFRRVLLEYIEGAAISSVRIEGVQHEFQSIPGVVEDVTDIVLNLKKVLIKSASRDTVRLRIDVDRAGEIRAKDIQPDAAIQIINPDQLICTLDKKQRFEAEVEIRSGRGYALADDNKSEDQPIGVVAIDSFFSPVKHVKSVVQNTRVGQMTDYDKLTLDIETNGCITPDEALKEATAILKHHLNVFDTVTDEKVEFENEGKEVSEEQNRLRKLLNMSVNEIELSVRAANCLNNANITTVGELALKTEQEMLKYRNFGKKSLNEIKQKLEQLGLSLGMKLDERLIDRSAAPAAPVAPVE